MIKKNWKHKECDGCNYYNPECRQGVYSIYPYRKWKKTEAKGEEVNDTG